METEEYKRFQFSYGLVMVRTRRFQALMDRLGRNRISKPAGWFLLYFMPVAGAIGFYLFFSQILILLSPRGAAVISYIKTITPLANLGLPGINPYLPLVDGWLALIVAMVIHEGAHGVVARSLGLPVKSSGLIFLLILPLGAFVDVDETAIQQAKSSYSGRVLAAGAGINFIVAIVCLLLIFGLVSSMRPAVDGVAISGVRDQSPAANAGFKPGDFILAVNGIHYDEPGALGTASWYQPNNTVVMTIWRGGTTSNYTIKLGDVVMNDTRTGTLIHTAYIGVGVVGYSGLQSTVSTYTGSFFTRPILYLCIPTFPNCQGLVPFSDQMSIFYTSSFGSELFPAATLLYWLFFINFNLAIFNSLPIYPLDGGQAFRVAVKAAGGSRLSERNVMRITVGATLFVAAMVLGVVAVPYLL